MRYHLMCESKKNDPDEHIYKTEIDPQTQNTLMTTKGEGGINLEFGINIHTGYISINNNDLLYSTENNIQYLCCI